MTATTFTLTVQVTGDGLTVEEAKRLVQRLIDAGKEDASNTPDDWEDPDAEACAALEVEVK